MEWITNKVLSKAKQPKLQSQPPAAKQVDATKANAEKKSNVNGTAKAIDEEEKVAKK